MTQQLELLLARSLGGVQRGVLGDQLLQLAKFPGKFIPRFRGVRVAIYQPKLTVRRQQRLMIVGSVEIDQLIT